MHGCINGWMDGWMDAVECVVGLDCIKTTSTLTIVVLQRQEWMEIDCCDGCRLRRVDWMRIESCRGPFPSPVWRCQVQFGDAESSLATLDLSSVELQFGEKKKFFTNRGMGFRQTHFGHAQRKNPLFCKSRILHTLIHLFDKLLSS